MTTGKNGSNNGAYLQGKIVFSGRIRCLTGLHIGGAETGVDVGGIDKFVVRNPLNDEPYIPGSSIKGKVRSLIEYAVADEAVLKRVAGIAVMPDVPKVKDLFGVAINNQTRDEVKSAASKVLFRDAIMLFKKDDDTNRRFSNGLKYTERKAENVLKRITAAATPRQIERVPAGTSFKFSLVVNVDNSNSNKIAEQLGLLKLGFQLLDKDGLGGMVSRGYGQVAIKWRKIEIWRVLDDTLKLDEEYQGRDWDSLITRVAQLWTQAVAAN